MDEQSSTVDHERLALIARRTSYGAVITDARSRVIWANEGYARLTGYSLEELRGKVPGHLLQCEKTDVATTERIRSAVRAGEGIRCEVLNRSKSGCDYWVDLDIQPLRDDADRLTGFMAIQIDITERKLAEQQLRASEQFLQTLVDMLPQRVFWKAQDGRYLGANRAFREDAGCEVTGHDDHEMPWRGEQAEFYRSCDRRVMTSGTPELDIIEPQTRPDGSLLWLSTSKVPLRNADGGIYGVLGTYMDISALKRTETELIAARHRAEDAARAKSLFLAMMSHEIRTPMNAVLGTASLLLETSLTDEQRDYVRTIHGSGEALLAVLNDILDFSKIEADRLTLEHAPFSLERVCADVGDLLAATANAKGVRLSVHLAHDVPAWVDGDAARVRQVLLNLAANAVKFTGAGVVRLEVAQGRAEAGNPGVRISVRDTGAGIPAGLLPQLFEPFEQGDASAARRFGGTGLGLAICKRLVKLMGGSIGVESTPGVGSTFWFELPLAPASPPMEIAATPAVAAGTEPLCARVLVAEDNIVNQKMASLMLLKLGCQVDVAANGVEAVDMQRRFGYDLILMDWQMPEMDGIEAARRIRALPGTARVPIVAMTANAMRGDREDCLAAGMDDYLPKPISLQRLREVVARWTSLAAPSPR